MTTLTLTIGGTDFLPRYVTGSAKVTQVLANQGDTLDLKLAIKSGGTLPVIGSEIIFKDGSRTLFGGFISKLTPVEYGVGQLITYDLEATDYTYLLINKSAQALYQGQTLGYIVADLLSSSVAAGYGMTHTHTATGPTITTVAFNHISLRQCFENLAQITGYYWWVDYNKDVHFVDPGSIASAPETFKDATPGNHESVAITVDISQVRNDIIVQGGTAESASYQQVLVGDGQAKEWVLVYPVQTMVSVELSVGGGGYSSQTYGVDPKDDPTTFQFMYSPERGSIRTGTASTPAGGATPDKVRVTFTYPFPVISKVQDASSVAALKLVEGGDGVHSYTITDSSILSQDQAKQRALKELAQFSQPILQGVVVTRTGLLSGGSYFSPGQALTVNFPSWGISSDTTYVVQKVVTTMDESGSAIEYHYEVTFGGRLLGVTDFLLALATPQEPLDTSGTVATIYGISEVASIIESIAQNQNYQSITESATVAETAPSMITFTPPYQWQPSGNPAKWGKAQWG